MPVHALVPGGRGDISSMVACVDEYTGMYPHIVDIPGTRRGRPEHRGGGAQLRRARS